MNCSNALSRLPNVLKDREFLYNELYVKKFGFNGSYKYKITVMKCVKNSLVEIDDRVYSKKCSVNDSKLLKNISRAKQKIFELAFCNNWEYFFTGTLDSKKYNRSDLEKFHKDFSLFIRNYNRNHNCNIKFLVVPELHSDKKSWHLHGFLKGIPPEDLFQFQIGDKMGKAIADKVKARTSYF